MINIQKILKIRKKNSPIKLTKNKKKMAKKKMKKKKLKLILMIKKIKMKI